MNSAGKWSALDSSFDEGIDEYIRREVVSLDCDASVAVAAKVMKEKGTGSVIITVRGEAKGIVTERDVLYKVVAEGKNPSKVRLKDVMSSPLVTIQSKATIKECIALMAKHGVRRLAVKTDDKVTGMISQKNVIGDLQGGIASLPELELAKGVKCPYCESTYPDKEELSRHIDRIHIGSGLLEGDLRQW